MKPYAYLVVNDQGYIVGGWKEKEIADEVCAKGQPSHNQTVVPVFDSAPHIETEVEKEAEFFLNILMKEGSIGESYDEIDVYEALSHIRALLAERGIK